MSASTASTEIRTFSGTEPFLPNASEAQSTLTSAAIRTVRDKMAASKSNDLSEHVAIVTNNGATETLPFVERRSFQPQIPHVASFTALQEWDGFVSVLRKNSFLARLTDITGKGPADAEEVEIPFQELDDAAVTRLKPGCLFRWVIGYERSAAGQKTRVSRIILRQLPRWRGPALEQADQDAADLMQSINWR